MTRRRPKTTPIEDRTTIKGEVCDSAFEAKVINDLIRRDVEYVLHPEKIPYHRPVRGGFCLECDSNKVRKGALYTPDLYLIVPGIYVELKGGTMTQASRGRLVNLIQSWTDSRPLHFVFRQDRTLGVGSTTKYSQWAKKYGCPWHVGNTIPEEWL